MSSPLKGIRVLELGQFIAGPYAGLQLADLGARVIKVERPQGGDAFREFGLSANAQGYSHNFCAFNRNKLSITLDVGLPRHPAERFLPARRIDIQRDAQLVAVERAEVVAVPLRIRAETELPERVPALGPFDLDHPGAEIGELQPRVGAGDELPQLEDADAFQRAGHARSAVSRVCRSRAPGDTSCRRETASCPLCGPARGRGSASPSLSP